VPRRSTTIVAFLADLLSLPLSERHPLPDLSPQRKKERTLEALIRQLEGLACRQPIVMVFEDAHWMDPTSRELLDLTVERVRSLPVLLVVTFRSELQPLWIGQPQVTMLALNRLDLRDRKVLVEQIAGGKLLPDEVVDQIADHTDGVPLFVEELTKSILENVFCVKKGIAQVGAGSIASEGNDGICYNNGQSPPCPKVQLRQAKARTNRRHFGDRAG